MDDYVGKPFSRATLHAVLSRWLASRRSQDMPVQLSGGAAQPVHQ
jgi:DNA-binding response OmpR family regulator